MERSIEIYYNMAEIPGFDPDHPNTLIALDFRNDAMKVIEAALEARGAGEWLGAEIGMGEVNIGFCVRDFAEAEEIVRIAVTGTPFANIREIAHRKF